MSASRPAPGAPSLEWSGLLPVDKPSGMTSHDVVVTHDLSFARVFVSIMGSPEERGATMQALGHAAGFVRHELGPRLGLREVPEVRFVHDDSLERGARVEDLLKRLHDGRPVEDEEPE